MRSMLQQASRQKRNRLAYANVLLGVACLIAMMPRNSLAETSQCFGTTAKGRLEGGVRLPISGDNFTSYSLLAHVADRTYVHSRVRDVMMAAWKSLKLNHPDKVFKYAETGHKAGGPFPPHKTHQNGLSVDFMTPVLNADGESDTLPTHALNRLGYDIEFDSSDQADGYRIDYDALAAHLVALHKAAKTEGIDIWRVIFDPHLQPKLLRTQDGRYLKKHLTFSTLRSWVRHDEHYHVDFRVPCKAMD